jgi:hypothetical protein
MMKSKGQKQDIFIRRAIIVVLTAGWIIGAIVAYSDVLSGRVLVTPQEPLFFIITGAAALGVTFAIPVAALVIIVYVILNAYRVRK